MLKKRIPSSERISKEIMNIFGLLAGEINYLYYERRGYEALLYLLTAFSCQN